MVQFSNRIKNIKPSPTLALNAQTKKMQAEGIPVINFTCGEPDFDTPEHINQAAVDAIRAGFTRYTPVGGIIELKDAVVRALKREQELTYSRDEIIITPGAKYAILAGMQAVLNEGDEVLIPAPYWVSYPDQAMLCGATPVIIKTGEENNFKATVPHLEKFVSSRTKILILNSPSNPTGMIYTDDELREIAKFCVKHDLLVISDEIYDHIVFDGRICKSIACFDGMKGRTLVINGVSKRYAMTGWRMGFAAGPAELIAKMAIIQGQAITNVTSITQKACIAAYDGPQEPVAKMNTAFLERRNFMAAELNKIPGLKCTVPDGSFYVFPNVSALFGKTLGQRKIANAGDLSEYLLEAAHVATVPGTAFGCDGYIRISFATSMENIKEGLKRMRAKLL